MKKYTCNFCGTFFNETDIDNGDICPVCNHTLKQMCDEDKVCTCIVEITGGVNVCPTCGEFTCPCGSHSVAVVSRVTGYLAEVDGWGAGKRAEFMDRTRYNETDGSVVNDYIK